MDWILFLLYSDTRSLAGRGIPGDTAGKRGSSPCFLCQGSVSAVCACLCHIVCQWCGCVRTLLQPSFRVHGLLVTLHPQPGPRGHLPAALSTHRRCTLWVWHAQHSGFLCVFAHQHWLICVLEPFCLWSHAGLGKPAKFSSTQWPATIPSPTRFELSLGDNHPFPNFLCYTLAALEFTWCFYSHSPVIAY